MFEAAGLEAWPGWESRVHNRAFLSSSWGAPGGWKQVRSSSKQAGKASAWEGALLFPDAVIYLCCQCLALTGITLGGA